MNRFAWPVALSMVWGSAIAQAQTDPWAAIRRLVGEWSGTSSGQPGDGTVGSRTQRSRIRQHLQASHGRWSNRNGDIRLGAEWKARETYQFVSDDEFIETFEFAAPGKPYQPYSRALLKRVRR